MTSVDDRVGHAPRPVSAGRLRSLDGLRGVAALVVVIHHLFLVLPQVATMPTAPVVGSVRWLIEDTPLKVVTAGGEAVLVFFVLSGMVVALPVLRNAHFDWLAYYPRRIVRLGVPVLASVGFATILILVHPQVLGGQVSAWVGAYSFPTPTPSLFVNAADLFLLDNPVNNPLWTIRLEVLFSLALPIFVVGATALRRHWALSLAIALALVWVGLRYDNRSLQYFPVFFAGTLLAVHHDALAAWAARTRSDRRSTLAWPAVLLGGLAVLVLGWLVWPLVGPWESLRQLATAASFLGAVVIVAVAFLWSPAVRFLEWVPVRWLGRVSFSLYLVHVPIIDFWANVFGPGHWPEVVACTIPCALAMAELFTRFVEQPAHRLSKRAGAFLATRFRSETTTAERDTASR